jgi:Cof subfamily protein (haloacid dehalogenase superfamily)
MAAQASNATGPSPRARGARPFVLVVLYLDGTVQDLYHHAPVSAGVKSAIAAVQAEGIPVTIATGRTLDYIRQHMSELGVTAPVVTTQGAVVGDPVTGRILAETTIPLPLARQAAAWIDAQPFVTALYFHDDDGRIHIYQNREGEDKPFLDHVFGFPRELRASFTPMLADEAARAPLKFIVVEDFARFGIDVREELTARFSPQMTITRTHPQLVEGTAQGVDKGMGVLHLCEVLGVDPRRVLAIGDSDNDIPMLEAVGFGVAMGNSTPGVIAAAKYNAPSVQEDGVAVVLQELILDKLE